MRISDWSSDVCSSDLKFGRLVGPAFGFARLVVVRELDQHPGAAISRHLRLGERDVPATLLPIAARRAPAAPAVKARNRRFDVMRRSEEHTSELQSIMRISYAVFCLQNKRTPLTTT